jgi:hypothetical protein
MRGQAKNEAKNGKNSQRLFTDETEKKGRCVQRCKRVEAATPFPLFEKSGDRQKIEKSKFGPGKKAIVKFNPRRLNQWVEELSHEPESENEKQKRHEKPKKSNRKVLEQFNDSVANI